MIRISNNFVSIDPELKPVEFWPYTTHVRGRLLEMQYSQGDHIDDFSKELLKMFREAGFNAHLDNKIAFGLQDEKGNKYYFGFKDFVFIIGTDFETDFHNLKRKQKKD